MAKNDQSKYRLFAAYYVGEANFNATRAAELVGIQAKNKHSLQSIASGLLNRPEVQEYINKAVSKVQITQEALLGEMAKLAFWDHEKDDPSKLDPEESGLDEESTIGFRMEEAKLYDTKMRAKLKALSDLMKTFNNDLAKEIAKVRKAIEQHREQFPDMPDKERADLFKAHVDPKMVEQVMQELLASDENRKRLAEVEAEVEEPMESVNG